MRSSLLALVCLAAVGVGGGAERERAELLEPGPPTRKPPPRAGLKVVKLPALLKAIEAHRGKVVLVYFWGVYSPFDRRELRRVVEMQQRLEEEGLVTVSVCLDPSRRKFEECVREVVVSLGATFENFLLDEEQQVWLDRLGVEMPPAVLLFDRAGRRAAKIDLFDLPADAKSLTTFAGKAVKGLLATRAK